METLFLCVLAALAAIVGSINVASYCKEKDLEFFILKNSYALEFKEKWLQRLCRTLAFIYIIGSIATVVLCTTELNVFSFIIGVVLLLIAFYVINIICFLLFFIVCAFIAICMAIKEWVWD